MGELIEDVWESEVWYIPVHSVHKFSSEQTLVHTVALRCFNAFPWYCHHLADSQTPNSMELSKEESVLRKGAIISTGPQLTQPQCD